MKIINNNFNTKIVEKSERHTCRWCKSIFEYELSDISYGDISLSQQEEYYNIKGLICPCCNRFDNIKNGY